MQYERDEQMNGELQFLIWAAKATIEGRKLNEAGKRRVNAALDKLLNTTKGQKGLIQDGLRKNPVRPNL